MGVCFGVCVCVCVSLLGRFLYLSRSLIDGQCRPHKLGKFDLIVIKQKNDQELETAKGL